MRRWVEKVDRRSHKALDLDQANERLLTRLIIDEVVIALGFPPRSLFRLLLYPVVAPAARRFSQITVQFDRISGERGFPGACRWVLPYFTAGIEVTGLDSIPESGPLLILGNHPGIVDAVMIASVLRRQDVRVIVSGVPFMRGVPNAATHLIYSSHHPGDRVRVVRESIRHLREGGSLVVLPAGRIEPDPVIFHGALETLQSWSPSVGVMARSVKDLQLIVAVSGGVLSPESLRTPLTRLANTDLEKQQVAEFIQVIRQMIFPDVISVVPRVHFSESFVLSGRGGLDVDAIMTTIREKAHEMMQDAFYLNGSHSTP